MLICLNENYYFWYYPMNEHIKNLADEAAKFSAVMALPTGESGDELFVERFAELIVRHCTYQCYLIGESSLAHELSDEFGFKFDFRKMMEEDE